MGGMKKIGFASFALSVALAAPAAFGAQPDITIENARFRLTIGADAITKSGGAWFRPYEAESGEWKFVVEAFDKCLPAAGRVAAEEVAFYPPGIPAIVPGEIVTPEVIDYLRETARIGLKVTGPHDPSLSTICVVK